jgi:hypothetical protein
MDAKIGQKLSDVLDILNETKTFNNELIGAIANEYNASSMMGKACQFGNEDLIKSEFISLLVEIVPDSLEEAVFILKLIKQANQW